MLTCTATGAVLCHEISEKHLQAGLTALLQPTYVHTASSHIWELDQYMPQPTVMTCNQGGRAVPPHEGMPVWAHLAGIHIRQPTSSCIAPLQRCHAVTHCADAQQPCLSIHGGHTQAGTHMQAHMQCISAVLPTAAG